MNNSTCICKTLIGPSDFARFAYIIKAAVARMHVYGNQKHAIQGENLQGCESPMFKYVLYEGQVIKNAILSCIKDWVVESSAKYFDVIKDVSF